MTTNRVNTSYAKVANKGDLDKAFKNLGQRLSRKPRALRPPNPAP